MGKVNPINFAFHIKQDDLDPPFKIKLYDSNIDETFNLTDYTGKFYMALTSDKSSPKINGENVNITDAEAGEAQYEWEDGDTDTAGRYYYEFRFTKDNKTFTVPVISPGVVYIETKIGSS